MLTNGLSTDSIAQALGGPGSQVKLLEVVEQRSRLVGAAWRQPTEADGRTQAAAGNVRDVAAWSSGVCGARRRDDG